MLQGWTDGARSLTVELRKRPFQFHRGENALSLLELHFKVAILSFSKPSSKGPNSFFYVSTRRRPSSIGLRSCTLWPLNEEISFLSYYTKPLSSIQWRFTSGEIANRIVLLGAPTSDLENCVPGTNFGPLYKSFRNWGLIVRRKLVFPNQRVLFASLPLWYLVSGIDLRRMIDNTAKVEIVSSWPSVAPLGADCFSKQPSSISAPTISTETTMMWKKNFVHFFQFFSLILKPFYGDSGRRRSRSRFRVWAPFLFFFCCSRKI